ncbi:cell filamentation protein Fic [Bradyrhizobium ottawaense]|uniref:Fic family protein n=1 Tax=Bradyrhizobium ottawaense TaxID=931866 RepID=UPI000BE8F32D|nr:Fic family protein [Bradyrhizobium ottawaense]PDT64077.1 cell filamentation protein Fic [Bradyrhizobium ottawaense]
MASLNEKLAGSLSNLRELSKNGDRRVFKLAELGRADRQRLSEAGFLSEIIRGWVLMVRPGEKPGDTTSWYSSFWQFCRAYLDDRFDKNWVVSPEASIVLHAENLNVPPQVIVHSPAANNQRLDLLHNNHLYLLRVPKLPTSAVEVAGMRAFSQADALCLASPTFWQNNKNDVIALLGSIRGTTTILNALLAGGYVLAAGRLAGAYRLLGNARAADEIVATMKRAGHEVREDADPFKGPVTTQLSVTRPVSPIATRVKLMWAEMRDKVLQNFDVEPRRINDRDGYLASIDDRYTSDAYHSLSIEGYTVTEQLIEKVRQGSWNPDGDADDRQQRDALAAKGYWDAFQEVRAAVARILDGESAEEVVEREHLNWYRALFQPSLAAGIVKPENMAGYRQHLLHIRGSRHTPVNWETVPDAMESFFECLKAEQDPRVRAILGHFIFMFIHPLPDGNGRTGRFIMNSMLASAGIPWTIVPVDRRDEYMRALEDASGGLDIVPFTKLVVDCTKHEPPPPRRSKPGETLAEVDLNAVGSKS